MLHFDKIPLYGVLILSFGSGIVAATLVHFVVSPYLKKKILREVYGDKDEQEGTLSGASHSGVLFSKSPTLSERHVNADKQDITGRFYCIRFTLSSPTSPQWPPWEQRKVEERWSLWGGRGGIRHPFFSSLQHFLF